MSLYQAIDSQCRTFTTRLPCPRIETSALITRSSPRGPLVTKRSSSTPSHTRVITTIAHYFDSKVSWTYEMAFASTSIHLDGFPILITVVRNMERVDCVDLSAWLGSKGRETNSGSNDEKRRRKPEGSGIGQQQRTRVRGKNISPRDTGLDDWIRIHWPSSTHSNGDRSRHSNCRRRASKKYSPASERYRAII